LRREAAPAVALGGLLVVVAILAPAFFRGSNLADLIVNNLPVLVAAVGMTLVILAGHIDISIGSQFAICSVVAGSLAKAGAPMIVVGRCRAARRPLVSLRTTRRSTSAAARQR